MSYDRDAEFTERDGCVRTRRLCKSNRCVWYPSVLTLPPVFFEVDWDPWDPEEEGDGDGDGAGDSAASAEVGAVGDSAADANEGKEEDGDETDDHRKIEPRQFREDTRLVCLALMSMPRSRCCRQSAR